MYDTALLDAGIAAPDHLELDDGARAELAETGEGQTLQFFTSDGRLLLEYDSARQATKFYLPDGDLDLVSRGALRLPSQESISLEAPRVRVHGKAAADLSAGENAEDAAASVGVRPGDVSIAAAQVGVAAWRMKTCAAETHMSGESLSGDFGRIRWAAESVETIAGSIVQRATGMLQSIARLLRVKAVRQRTTIERDARLSAETIVSRSSEDTRIDGRQIHLG